ncbi:MAG: 50S ribosomal protein L9 [Candidatus Kerfeldbacteria bacterium]|nr:50S ribosomal protein L9 [Candidatus Kerfeldbacteria bacterium]
MQVIMMATGQLKTVPDGYARNYLLPNKLATAATAENVTQAESKQAQTQADLATQTKRYAQLMDHIAQTTVQVSAKANDQGKLFATVHQDAVLAALSKEQIVLPATALTLPTIKQLGEHSATVQLPGQTAVNLKINVVAA